MILGTVDLQDEAVKRTSVPGRNGKRSMRETKRCIMPTPIMTWGLAGVSIAMWVVVLCMEGLDPDIAAYLSYGANFGPMTCDGQWWRMLTNSFVHFGFWHLYGNMLCMITFGTIFESKI